MPSGRTITVYGAYGHTGRFVVDELLRRGWNVVLSGRDPGKLHALCSTDGRMEARQASVDDPGALDQAVTGSVAVINCAGPFAITAAPLIEAAIRAGVPYLDVAAEIEANLDTFAYYEERARQAGISVIPAMAFFGGLGSLLANAAAGDWRDLDELSIAYGLSSWAPTGGTRAAGQVSRQRRSGRRIVYADGQLQLRDDAAPIVEWVVPAPFGKQAAIAEFTMADTVTISRRFQIPEIQSYMTQTAVRDLSDSKTAPPAAVDDRQKSAQTFAVEVIVRSGDQTRRAVARGRDIYAISAPLVVEAAERILANPAPPAGAFSAGEIFAAHDFLAALSPDHLTLELPVQGKIDELAT